METVVKRYMVEGSKGKTKILSYHDLASALNKYTDGKFYPMTIWRWVNGDPISAERVGHLRQVVERGHGWVRDFAAEILEAINVPAD